MTAVRIVDRTRYGPVVKVHGDVGETHATPTSTSTVPAVALGTLRWQSEATRAPSFGVSVADPAER